MFFERGYIPCAYVTPNAFWRQVFRASLIEFVGGRGQLVNVQSVQRRFAFFYFCELANRAFAQNTTLILWL